MPLLQVKNLHVEIGGKKILNGLDLTVEKGFLQIRVVIVDQRGFLAEIEKSKHAPGEIFRTLPRLSRCISAPSHSQVTVASPMCGCGRTSIPSPGGSASGPM